MPQARRGDEIIAATPGLRLKEGDVAVVAGLRDYIVEHAPDFGEEVDDTALLDVPVDTLDVVVTQRTVIGKTVFELGRLPEARAIFPRRIMRSGEEIPIYGGLHIERGDVLDHCRRVKTRLRCGFRTRLRRPADFGDRHGFRRPAAARFPHRSHPAPRGFLLRRFVNAGRLCQRQRLSCGPHRKTFTEPVGPLSERV